MDNKLKPCPFCGSPARCLHGYETGRVCCSNENCCAYGLQAWPQHWNTRALETEIAALRAELADARRQERELCAQECDELGQSDGVTCAKELRYGMPALYGYHCTTPGCTGPEWSGAPSKDKVGTYVLCPSCGIPASVEARPLPKAELAARGPVLSEDGNKMLIKAIGLTHAYCCNSLDDGNDPRQVECPLVLKDIMGFLEDGDEN